jgi:deoxyribodipyrimidine photolyase-related protein
MGDFPIHRQKFLLHRLSLSAYAKELGAQGYSVTHIRLHELKDSHSIFTILTKSGYTTFHIVDTTDDWLERRIIKAIEQIGGKRVWYESSLFLLGKDEALRRYASGKKRMATFYAGVRRDFDILMTKEGDPQGGRWSFDTENRKRIPKGMHIPLDPQGYENEEIREAMRALSREQYGEDTVWFPYTRAGARELLHTFIKERLHEFGPYEDAMLPGSVRLFHSTLSPVLNIGLVTPREVVDAACTYAEDHDVPLASLEGFIRQVIGWREFIRAAYEADGRVMRSRNFWNHTRALPQSYWTGTTGIIPVDDTIHKAIRYGYTHHIERLMVMGNFMLLSEINPDEVYTWFMSMYIDAYDWVMVPNVYGMSQFADGGIFATKPYLSGSNYLKKMGTYTKGGWDSIWDALFWHFIHTHRTYFSSQHRLSMMPRLFDRMGKEKQDALLARAEAYLATLA